MTDVTVSSGVTSSGLMVASGDRLTVLSGGSASATTVSAGGVEVVERGAVAWDTQVLSGGVEIRWKGGLDRHATISAGGVLELALVSATAGQTLSARVEASTVSSGGAILQAGAALDLLSARVLSGGAAIVGSGGIASATRVFSGGAEFVSFGGLGVATIIGSGGVEQVLKSGVTSGSRIVSGGAELVSAGGESIGTLVGNGGVETVFSSGLVSAAVIGSGGTAVLSKGAHASGIAIDGGGLLHVVGDGLASGTIVSSGGQERLAGNGGEFDPVVMSGAKIVDNSFLRFSGSGHTLNGSLSGTGNIYVEPGAAGSAGNTVLNDEGSLFFGTLYVNSSTVELESAEALGGGRIEFLGGRVTVQVDAAAAPAPGGTFANQLLFFASKTDALDLRSIKFVTGARAVVSGGTTLVLTEGGQTYNFSVGGNVGSLFAVTGDGHGGTRIQVAAGPLVQAAATLAAGRGAAASAAALARPYDLEPSFHATTSAGGRA